MPQIKLIKFSWQVELHRKENLSSSYQLFQMVADHKFLEEMWESLEKVKETLKHYCTIIWAWTSLEIYECSQK